MSLTPEEFMNDVFIKYCMEGLNYWVENYCPIELLEKKDEEFAEACKNLLQAQESVEAHIEGYMERDKLEYL